MQTERYSFSFLLVIPGTFTLCAEDRVHFGAGPVTITRASYNPSMVSGLVVFKYVNPKAWPGRMRGALHYRARTGVKGCCNAAAERRNEKRRLRLIFTVRAVSLGLFNHFQLDVTALPAKAYYEVWKKVLRILYHIRGKGAVFQRKIVVSWNLRNH